MIEVITAKNEWNSMIDEADAYDFYSTYDYHALTNPEDGRPIMIKYSQGDQVIGLPLLIRKIKDTPYFDATSVYGYAGPISKNVSDKFNNELFKNELVEFFEANKVVSVFSRLNPYLPNQDVILANIGEIKSKGHIVTIDLSEPLEAQRQHYQKRIKSHINRARRLCTIKRASSKEDITTFKNLYYENMHRVDAKKSYFFSDEYFYNFTHNDKSKIEILLATLNETDEIISGAMFIKTKDIIQYHLSGTKTDYLDISAIKLLIDEMRIEGTNENYKILNLGGGLNSKDDSLLRFKKSFSKTINEFSVWQFVVNEPIYDELNNAVEIVNFDFFPGYRSPH